MSAPSMASNLTDVSTPVLIQANHATLVAWLVLNVWPSHFGLVILLATILFSKRIKRHATFVNMVVIWMLVGFSSSILLYAGETTGPEPSKMLCLFQASLLYTVPAMASLSAFALVFEVFYLCRSAYRELDPNKNLLFRKWMLLFAPYIGLGFFSTATAWVGGSDPSRISRDRRFFYCSVESELLTNTITGFSTIVLTATLALEFWIGRILYVHWRTLKGQNHSARVDLSFTLRAVAFGLYVFLGLGLSILSMKAPHSPIPDMALATMGSAVVLIFGTQKDIVRVWCFWRRDGFSHADSVSPKPPMRYNISKPEPVIEP